MVEVEHVWQEGGPVIGNTRNNRKDLSIGHAEKDGSNQKAQYPWDQIIKITPAKTGQAGARSETGQGHTYAKHQRADKVAN